MNREWNIRNEQSTYIDCRQIARWNSMDYTHIKTTLNYY